MADRPEATVRLVEEAGATGRGAKIFADIRATKKIDFVPSFWRALAITNASIAPRCWTRPPRPYRRALALLGRARPSQQGPATSAHPAGRTS